MYILMLLGAGSIPIAKYPAKSNYLTNQTIHPERVPSERINSATEPIKLLPLTPDEWERNQAIADRLLDKVFDGDDPIDYKSLLSHYIQTVANTEGIHFIGECSTANHTHPNLVFTPKEIKELYALFDEF